MDLNTGLTQTLSDGAYAYLYGNGRVAQLNTDTLMTEYFLGDALGSVRQLTDSNGNLTLSKTYDPYGTVAQSAGAGQSDYGYTGEYQDGYNDLVYLRARHYAPGMGRFLSRDTWVGNENQPMSYNLWLYGYANPARFTDPTGMYSVSEIFGLEFIGQGWEQHNKQAVESAVARVSYRFMLALGLENSDDLWWVQPDVFKRVYGIRDNDPIQFKWGGDKCHYCRPKSCQDLKIWTNNDPGCKKTDTCSCEPVGGFCHYARKIEFASLWDNYTGTGGVPVQNLRKINNVIHELGHAFSGRLERNPGIQVSDHSTIINRETWRMNSRDPKTYGFYEDANTSGTRTWVQTGVVDSEGSEVFADMFIGWVYNKWENSLYGAERKKFMDENMPNWIRQAMALP